MLHGVIRNRYIHSLDTQSVFVGDKTFFIHNHSIIPPLFIYNSTRYNCCYFVNKYGIYTLKQCCVFKRKLIHQIYHFFYSNKFTHNYKTHEEKINIAIEILKKNNINVEFIYFQNVKYNSKNIEYHTNLAKETIMLFQALNSTLPYP